MDVAEDGKKIAELTSENKELIKTNNDMMGQLSRLTYEHQQYKDSMESVVRKMQTEKKAEIDKLLEQVEERDRKHNTELEVVKAESKAEIDLLKAKIEEKNNQEDDLGALMLGRKSTERMENMQKKMEEMTEENS